jgi:hypothetical protein
VLRNSVIDLQRRPGSTSLFVKTTTTVGENRRTFLRFSLSTVVGSVVSAKLRLFGSRPTSTGITDGAFAVQNNTWSETGITWNTQPDIGTRQSGVVITTTPRYYEWDVTSFVRAQKIAGAPAVSLAVAMDANTQASPDTFNSRQASSNRPQLVVTVSP